MNTVALCLEPLDVLFFRDGKPFTAAARAESGQPMPQTLTGALRTALLERHGFDFERLAAHLRDNRKNGRKESIQGALRECGAPLWILDAQVRGPFLARLDKQRNIADVLVPVPAILHRVKDKPDEAIQRLKPLKKGVLPGWKQDLRPLWLRHKEATEAASGYLTSEGLRTFLEGGIPEPAHLVKSESLFAFDNRTGIEVSPDALTAKDGGIYGASFLALHPGYKAPSDEGKKKDEQGSCPAVVLYAEIVFSEAPPPECAALDGAMLPLGGEGRRVAVRKIDRWKWPQVKPTNAKQKPLLLLTTPGLFPKECWRPSTLKDHLVAAAVPGTVAVSGWDLARGGPKPNRFAASAGSVYFLDSLPDNLLDALSDCPEDRAQGWGCYLKGVWNDD